MKPVRILEMSDIHLGHRRADPDEMVGALSIMIQPYLDKVDIIVINGDLFDGPVGFGDRASNPSLAFIVWLLSEANDRDITILLVRGTFDHDRLQMGTVPQIHASCGYTNDLRYYDAVGIDYLEKYDLKFCHIPDSLPYPNSDTVVKSIRQMMGERGWDTLDYAFIHGTFEHVFPKGIKLPPCTFNVEQFDFVTRYVLVGHIHKHSVHKHCIYAGSTDRLAQDEEEPKGCLYIRDDVTKAKVTFVENKEAIVQVTYDLRHLTTVEEVVTEFRDRVNKIKTQRLAYVRVTHESNPIKLALAKVAAVEFPNIRFSPHSVEKKDVDDSADEVIVDVMSLERPDPVTLPQLVSKFLDVSCNDTQLSKERVKALLDSL